MLELAKVVYILGLSDVLVNTAEGHFGLNKLAQVRPCGLGALRSLVFTLLWFAALPSGAQTTPAARRRYGRV